jgi:predicted dehydrogenase
MVGHQYVYKPAVQEFKRRLPQAVGPLSRLSLTVNNRLRAREDVDIVYDLGPHALSLLHDLVGAPPRWLQATAVTAAGRPWHPEWLGLSLVYGDDVQAAVTLSWLDPRKTFELTATGPLGELTYREVSLRRTTLRRAKRSPAGVLWAEEYDVDEGPAIPDAVTVELHTFLDCVERRQTPPTDAAHAVRIVSWLEAVRASAQDGRRRFIRPNEEDHDRRLRAV